MNDPADDEESFFRMHRQFELRHRRERLPRSAGELVSQLIARRGFTQELASAELQEAWQAAAGPRFAGRTRATLVRRGTLEVVVESSPALQQLGFDRQRLLGEIQKSLPSSGIRAIRFRVGPVT